MNKNSTLFQLAAGLWIGNDLSTIRNILSSCSFIIHEWSYRYGYGDYSVKMVIATFLGVMLIMGGALLLYGSWFRKNYSVSIGCIVGGLLLLPYDITVGYFNLKGLIFITYVFLLLVWWIILYCTSSLHSALKKTLILGGLFLYPVSAYFIGMPLFRSITQSVQQEKNIYLQKTYGVLERQLSTQQRQDWQQNKWHYFNQKVGTRLSLATAFLFLPAGCLLVWATITCNTIFMSIAMIFVSFFNITVLIGAVLWQLILLFGTLGMFVWCLHRHNSCKRSHVV